MRTLGLVGGTSWHSTIKYYQDINLAVNEYFGNNTNPPLILYNLNQATIHHHQKENQWDRIAEIVFDAGKRLQMAGAEAILFCANTTHKVFEPVSYNLEIPVLHISDAIAKAINGLNLRKVCFIGTKFSMAEGFVTERIAKSNVEVLTPGDSEVIEKLHSIIHKELVHGNIVPSSKRFVLDCIKQMLDLGAEGVVLGCTEFPLMIESADLNVPIFDTVRIHSKAATDFILNR